MTREEAEARILDHAMEIKKIVQGYNPKDDYFTLTFCNGSLFFSNNYLKHPDEGVIDYFKRGGETEWQS